MKSRLRLLFLGSPAEAIHLGSLVAAHGYIFPISDHVLTLKDDGTLYRFQVGEFWCETMVRYQEDFSIVKLIITIPAKLISIKVNAVYPNWGGGGLLIGGVFSCSRNSDGSKLLRPTCWPLIQLSGRPRPHAPPTFICLWMHSSSPPLLNIYSHDWGRARRATCVTLAHSAASKNIPSDVAVMQQPRVIGRGTGP